LTVGERPLGQIVSPGGSRIRAIDLAGTKCRSQVPVSVMRPFLGLNLAKRAAKFTFVWRQEGGSQVGFSSLSPALFVR
jgi:hypothetical protein